jgi:hypothetical protein
MINLRDIVSSVWYYSLQVGLILRAYFNLCLCVTPQRHTAPAFYLLLGTTGCLRWLEKQELGGNIGYILLLYTFMNVLILKNICF